MDIKAYINTIVKSSFVEIEDILCRINKDMQCSYKGNLLIRKQQVLLNDIKQMYEIIYRPALDMGLQSEYLQPVITQYFASNKSEIWS